MTGKTGLSVAQLRGHAEDLGFTPQDQVRWLAPAELLRTAVQVGLAAAFSTYSDKRELQRTAGDEVRTLEAGPDGEVWIDFMADSGDGFDATYTVVSLLAADSLSVNAPDGEPLTLPRGRLLVLGGDEVYPTASSDRYWQRLRAPMRLALPREGVPAQDRPWLLALPGNHDWYDGLTAFLRLFAQGRHLGAWDTVQGRSYFVMKLPHGWWLAGLDTQLGSEIDDPQLDFFRRHLSANLQDGDAVILCCPSPTWVKADLNPAAFDSLHYFERTIVRYPPDPTTGEPRSEWTGAEVRLWITGDHHHYARYQEALPADRTGEGRPRQLVTCGLGGAYLAATHRLPEHLSLPPAGSNERDHGRPRAYTLQARWPDPEESRRRRWGLLSLSRRGLPLRNPGFWKLAGVVHAALFLALIGILGVMLDASPVDAVRRADPALVWQLGGQILTWWLVAAAFSILQRSLRAKGLRAPGRLVNAVLPQLAIGVASVAVTVVVVRWVTLPDWVPGTGSTLPDFLLLLAMLLGVGLVAGMVGSYAVALTFALARSQLVQSWQDSAQAIEDRKGFIRMRLDADGRLQLFPVVIDTVAHAWDLEVSGRRRVRIRPSGGFRRPYLAEQPFVIDRRSAPRADVPAAPAAASPTAASSRMAATSPTAAASPSAASSRPA